MAVKKCPVIGENPVFDKHLKVWRTLQHLHVAQHYGAGSDGGAPFFVYEYASLQNLDRCWDQLPQKELWRLLHQAALGLLYLHKKHIVYGNFSISKLLVIDQGIVKLFGFGASYFRENDKCNSITPITREDFSAPECIGPDGIRHSPRFESDVYSSGLTIIEAISKNDPFFSVQREDISMMKRDEQLPQPQTMSCEAWNLVKKICLRDPSQRVSLAYVTEQLGRFV